VCTVCVSRVWSGWSVEDVAEGIARMVGARQPVWDVRLAVGLPVALFCYSLILYIIISTHMCIQACLILHINTHVHTQRCA
jgi:hypothetical protein